MPDQSPDAPPWNPMQPFSRARAKRAGVTDAALRGPGFVQLFQGIHVSSAVDVDLRTRVRAALLTQRKGAVVVGSTAASLLGLPVPHSPVIRVGVLTRSDRRPRPGISSVVENRRSSMTSVGGVPVATGATLFLQLAGELPLVDLVVVGDAMVRRGILTRAVLVKGVASARCTGSVSARRAAALVRERVDSPMETRLRLLLVFAGFPEPDVNPTIDQRYRPDLCWPALKLILEYQGQHHRYDLDQWDHDIERGEYLERYGWFVAEVVARDVFQRPDALLDRVYALWLERGGRPFKRAEDWRAHFPVTSQAAAS